MILPRINLLLQYIIIICKEEEAFLAKLSQKLIARKIDMPLIVYSFFNTTFKNIMEL